MGYTRVGSVVRAMTKNVLTTGEAGSMGREMG